MIWAHFCVCKRAESAVKALQRKVVFRFIRFAGGRGTEVKSSTPWRFHFNLDHSSRRPTPRSLLRVEISGEPYRQIDSSGLSLPLFRIQEGYTKIGLGKRGPRIFFRSPGQSQPIAERSSFKASQLDATTKSPRIWLFRRGSSQVSGTRVVMNDSRE